MNIEHLMPALCAAILVTVGTTTPAMVEARDFEGYSHQASHYSRDSRHHRDQHYKPHSRHGRNFRHDHHYGHRHHPKHHYRRGHAYSQPHSSYYSRYGHHGDGVVSFSFRYRR
ncbi:MAG: hypothetical protein WAN46_15825 [Gammaproteobacteria bacterium]